MAIFNVFKAYEPYGNEQSGDESAAVAEEKAGSKSGNGDVREKIAEIEGRLGGLEEPFS